MGFDPNRSHKSRPSDIIFVASVFIVVGFLLLWAFAG